MDSSSGQCPKFLIINPTILVDEPPTKFNRHPERSKLVASGSTHLDFPIPRACFRKRFRCLQNPRERFRTKGSSWDKMNALKRFTRLPPPSFQIPKVLQQHAKATAVPLPGSRACTWGTGVRKNNNPGPLALPSTDRTSLHLQPLVKYARRSSCSLFSHMASTAFCIIN